jgi:hypothetical protein
MCKRNWNEIEKLKKWIKLCHCIKLQWRFINNIVNKI